MMDTPRFCIDCKHFQREEKAESEEDALRWGLCLKSKLAEWDLVSGQRKPEYLTAHAQRILDSGCGPSGQWWEKKS
jgi:hypothetical protein